MNLVQIVFSYLYHGLVGWIGVTGLVLVCSIYVFIQAPINWVRHICIAVGAVCLCILFLYPKAYFDGANNVKAQVAAAEQKLRQQGETARADAIRDAAGGVRDGWDIDADAK
jgi:membrane-bound ClpP family serine protease